MLCKPLFVVYDGVEGLYELILEYKNKAPQFEK